MRDAWPDVGRSSPRRWCGCAGCYFFFSSRRRHTRSLCDWSSDVCSSDLLAQAIEEEGFEVLGVTSYGDLSQFAQQQSRASAFILSIDDEEFSLGDGGTDPVIHSLRSFIGEVRRKNADVPIYIYGETKTSRHLPNDILRELHGFIHMFEDTPEFV